MNNLGKINWWNFQFNLNFSYDRDSYIDIQWTNVINGADDQFEKYGMNVIDQMNEPYDYSSIMHYGPYAFSSNGKRTILARKPGAGKMGQRVQFSEIDLRKINKLYNCNVTGNGQKIVTTPTTGNSNNNNNNNNNSNTSQTTGTTSSKVINNRRPYIPTNFMRPFRRWGPQQIINNLG